MRQKGASHLLLVLVVLLILTVIAFSVQLFAFIEARTTARTVLSNQTFFAAEGALYETLEHMRRDPGWPSSFPQVQVYNIGDTRIRRTIFKDSDDQTVINIQANTKGVRKELVADYGGTDEGGGNLDMVLLLDTSGSMNSTQIADAKNALSIFMDIIGDSGGSHRISLVTYSTNVSPMSFKTIPEFGDIRARLEDITDGSGGTSTSDALLVAKNILDTDGRDDAVKLTILFSDGLPRLLANSNTFCHEDEPYPCEEDFLLPSGFYGNYDPVDEDGETVGTCCTDRTIDVAAQIKQSGYLSFAVGVFQDFNDSRGRFGRLTLLRASSEPISQQLSENGGGGYKYYFEATDTSEMEMIYEQIAGAVLTPGFFQIREVPPEP